MAAPSTLPPARVVEVPAQPKQRWRKFVTPLAVVLLALAIVFTITRNWNSWEGGRIEQVTDDAYVRGDLTPLEGVKIQIERYRKAGIRDISHDFYSGGRHEMLNEINRGEVLTNLLGWISTVLERQERNVTRFGLDGD